MSQVLLVGDSRDVPNYGANATSDMLLNMLEKNEENEIRTISWRSLNSATPIDGWKQTPQESINNSYYSITERSFKEKLQDTLDDTLLMGEYRLIKKSIKKARGQNTGFEIQKYHVPYRFSDYEKYSEEVMQGKRLQYEKKMLEWADIVIVNGEGSIVNGTDRNGYYHVGGLYVLFMSYLSKVWFNKKTFIINHTVDPQNRDIYYMISKIYPKLDGVYVREPLSLNILSKQCGYNDAKYVPDALFSFKPSLSWTASEYLKSSIDFSKPYICVGDTSGFYTDRDSLFDVESMYDELIEKLRDLCSQVVFIVGFGRYYPPVMNTIRKNKLPYLCIHNSSYEDLYHVLQGAQIFISGRWHTSILSLLAGTPILLFGSDSHKTEALYEMINYPYRFFDFRTLALNVDSIVKETKTIIDADNSEYLNNVARITEESKRNAEVLCG